MSEQQDWILRLIKEKGDKEQASHNHARLAESIRSKAGELTGRVREAVRRDVARLNQEFYGCNALEISEVSDTGFAVERQRDLPHVTVRVRLWPNEHALKYTLTVQAEPNSRPEEGEAQKIDIIAGQNIEQLHFSKNNRLLSPDDVSRILIEPVVRAGMSEEGA